MVPGRCQATIYIYDTVWCHIYPYTWELSWCQLLFITGSTISLKTKDCQFDNFVITGNTISCHNYGVTSDEKLVKLTIFCFQWEGCHNDNSWCFQWWQRWHHNSLHSMYVSPCFNELMKQLWKSHVNMVTAIRWKRSQRLSIGWLAKFDWQSRVCQEIIARNWIV